MTDGVTVDACVMREFMEEFLSNVNGASRILIEQVTSTLGLVIDEGGKVKHEWLTTCQNPYFQEWYVTQLYKGNIREVAAKLPEQHKKAILRIGLPANSYDRVYIAVANATTIRYIVSMDIDFFDPKLKNANEKAKCQARDCRKGELCQLSTNDCLLSPLRFLSPLRSGSNPT